MRAEFESGSDNVDWTPPPDEGLENEFAWDSGFIEFRQYSPSGTYYLARVSRGFAIMAYGDVCVSGFPSDGRNMSN